MRTSVARLQAAGREERLAPLSEAAYRLGVSIFTIRYWIQHGRIESAKLGGRRLIPVSEIDRLIESSRVPARDAENTKGATAVSSLPATSANHA